MKVGCFTEGEWYGKVIGNKDEWLERNLRTDLAWWIALDANHHQITNIPHIEDNCYDVGILILPKNHIKTLSKYDLIKILEKKCKVLAIMQEGPHWYFQDYSIEEQVWFFNTLMGADIIFAHNKSDVKYYKGLTNKKHVYQNKSLMIHDNIKPSVELKQRDGVIIGGNFCRWYGGFDSYIIAQELNTKIFIPSMGRKVNGEELMQNLNHLPYMDWCDWINIVSHFKYGIHLMPTHAAGTFTLNCAYHGVPCIGYKGLDTQEICHPDLTVDVGDLNEAKKLAHKLKNDNDFYNHCVSISKIKYKECFDIEDYIYYMSNILKEVLNEKN